MVSAVADDHALVVCTDLTILVCCIHAERGPTCIELANKVKVCLTCLQILAGWSEQYGPVYRWRFGPKDILVVTDPVEVSKLCSKEANLPKFALAYKPINTVSLPLQSDLLPS